MNLLTEQLLARLHIIRFLVHNYAVSPLQTISKRDSSKLHVVHDLSFPEGVSSNSGIPKDNYSSDE